MDSFYGCINDRTFFYTGILYDYGNNIVRIPEEIRYKDLF